MPKLELMALLKVGDQHLVKAIDDVWVERKRQNLKWGIQNHTGPQWLAILMEEVGELAEAVLHDEFDNQGELTHGNGNIEEEAIQVAAVAVALVENLRRARA